MLAARVLLQAMDQSSRPELLCEGYLDKLKDQLKLKSKIRYPPLQKQNLISENEVLDKVCKFYGKTYEGTDPV